MKNIKRRIEPFSMYDHTGIEKHLKKMAEKGWMLEKFTPFGWVYRRTEPKTGYFAVTYYAKASEFDPEPTEGQQMYQDYTAQSGWQFLCSSAQMQIFYTDHDDPVPIETDPVIQVENIHNAAKKGFLLSYFLLFGVGILNGLLFISRLLGHPISVLSNPTNLFTGVCWTMLILLYAVELILYYRWRGKAKKAAEHGEFTDTPNTSRFQKFALVAALVVFAYWLVNIMSSGSVMMRWITVLIFGYMIVLLFVVNGVKQLLKRKKVSRSKNLTITLVVDVVLAFAMMGAITFGTIRASQTGLFDPDAETYEHHGSTFILHQDELPLTVEDLIDIDYDGYIREHSVNESVFLGVLDVFQHARLDGSRSDIPYLEYTVTLVKTPSLYEICKTKLVEKYSRFDDIRFPQNISYVPIDAEPWYAEEAYQLTQIEPMQTYLLCYEDRLIEIAFDWEATTEQMAIVGEKLGLVK